MESVYKLDLIIPAMFENGSINPVWKKQMKNGKKQYVTYVKCDFLRKGMHPFIRLVDTYDYGENIDDVREAYGKKFYTIECENGRFKIIAKESKRIKKTVLSVRIYVEDNL